MIGFIFGFAFSKLIDNLSSSFFDWAKEGLKNKLNSDLDSLTQHDQVKQLLSLSIKQAKKSKLVNQLKRQELIKSIQLNKHIIFEWISLSNESDVSFVNYSDKIIYYGYENNLKTFYNSLFNHIRGNKNNYETIQNLMVLDKLDSIKSTGNATYDLVKDNNIMLRQILNITYTGELKKAEDSIKMRKFKDARIILSSLELKILSGNDSDEKEKYYQLLTDSYFLDTANQLNAIEPLSELIGITKDNGKRKMRILYKNLLERNITAAQQELSVLLEDNNLPEIKQSLIDIQINIYLMQKEYDLGIAFIETNKNDTPNYLLWLCKLYYFKSEIGNAKFLIDNNSDYFNKTDYQIQILKITIISSYYLENCIQNKTFDNIQELNNLIPQINEILKTCEDDISEKSQLHSILGIIYSVIGDIDNAKKEYENSLQLSPHNMNTLKNYPFILLNSSNKSDKERALAYIKQYLDEYPNDELHELLYYNALVFLSPDAAIIELENYKGKNKDVLPFLIYAYDINRNFTKAENLISNILSNEIISSSAYFFIGLHYEAVKNYESSLNYYFLAFKKGATKNELDRVVDKLLKISVFSKNTNHIKNAVNEIESKYSFDELVLNFIEQFSYSLLVIHDFQKCFRYCEAALKNEKNSSYVYESLFSCYYNTQNFHSAFNLIEEYTKEFNQLPSYLLQSFSICCLKTGNYERAFELSKYLPEPISQKDYLYQSMFFDQIGKFQEAIIIAHKAYVSFPKNQQISEQFFNLGLIKKGNNSIPNHIAIDLKKCIDGYLNSDIKHKSLKSIQIDTTAKPEDILNQLALEMPNNKDIEIRLDIVNEYKLPVSFYKNVISKNILLIYDFIKHQSKYKIWCYTGYENLNIISKMPSVYIDIGTLFLLDTLGLLHFLPLVFSETLILQSIFDELLDFENVLPKTDQVGILVKDNDGNLRIQHDNIQYNELFDKSKRIITFINANKNVRVVGKPFNIINTPSPDLLKLTQSMKYANEVTIFEYAYISNTSIMLENVTFRELFDSLPNSPKSICIIAFLRYLLSQQKITFSKYCNALSIMSKQNYVCVPFDFKILLLLIEENGYIIDSYLTHIFESICTPNYNKEYAFSVLVTTICAIWNKSIGNETKYKCSDFIMNKIVFLINPTKDEFSSISNSISLFVYNNNYHKDFMNYIAAYIKNSQYFSAQNK